MTPRERFILALERKSFSGRVPHFELVFFLTMEAFGKVHPLHRIYEHWFQMKELERQLQFITHGELAGGGTLSFDMKNKPLIHRELVQMTCRSLCQMSDEFLSTSSPTWSFPGLFPNIRK